MKYSEIYNEYIALTSEKAEAQKALAGLSAGYISKKRISGKEYAYLQHRIDGKLYSKYIKKEELQKTRDELLKRAQVQEKLALIDRDLLRLESAAAILDSALYRKLIIYKRCALMDTLLIEDRHRTLAFGNAMAALEGIPADTEVEQNLLSWADGSLSYHESFTKVLLSNQLAEV